MNESILKFTNDEKEVNYTNTFKTNYSFFSFPEFFLKNHVRMVLAFAPSSQYVVTIYNTEFLIRYVKHFYSMLVKMNSLLELSIFIIAYSIKAYVIKFHISSTVLVTKYHLLDRIIPLCILFPDEH